MGADDQARQRVSDATKEAERRDAQVKAGPDRMPTEEEERLAEQQELDQEAAESYKESIERGAAAKGEGRIP